MSAAGNDDNGASKAGAAVDVFSHTHVQQVRESCKMRSAKMRRCEIEPRIKCEFDSAKLWCENMYKMIKSEK